MINDNVGADATFLLKIVCYGYKFLDIQYCFVFCHLKMVEYFSALIDTFGFDLPFAEFSLNI